MAFSFGAAAPAANNTFGGFGTSQPTTTPGFGQAAPAFGAASTATTTPFGSSTTTTTPGFGTNNTATSTGGFGFGSTSTAPAASTAGGFGFGSTSTAAPAAGGFAFGGTNTSAAPSTGFGFGATNTSTAPATSTGFSFGNATNTAAPATTSTGFSFGNATGNTGFGTFGANKANTFGTNTTANTSLFGGNTQTTSLFGNTNTMGLNNTNQQQQKAQQVYQLLAQIDQEERAKMAPSIYSDEYKPDNVWQALALLKSWWDPKSPHCRFKHYFYNLVAPQDVPRYQKPADHDQAAWDAAQMANPDPSKMVPALAIGFDDVEKRMDEQNKLSQAHLDKLNQIQTLLKEIQKKSQLETAVKLNEYKRRHMQTVQRVIKVNIFSDI